MNLRGNPLPTPCEGRSHDHWLCASAPRCRIPPLIFHHFPICAWRGTLLEPAHFCPSEVGAPLPCPKIPRFTKSSLSALAPSSSDKGANSITLVCRRARP